MKQINLRDANQQFSRLVREIEETGETVVVLRNGQPAAQLGPVAPDRPYKRSARQIAAIEGLIKSARRSTANSRGRRWTRADLYERD